MSIYNCHSCPGPGTLTCPKHQAYYSTPITVFTMDPPYFIPYTTAPETSTAGSVFEQQYTASGYPAQAPPYGHPIVSAKPCLREFCLPKPFLSILGVEMADRISLFHFRCSTLTLCGALFYRKSQFNPAGGIGTDFPLTTALAHGPSLFTHRLSSPSSPISTSFSWVFAAISGIRGAL